MARPTGRYFASTIAKIREVKKSETIKVDEGFKMQLRAQLMMKITGAPTLEKRSWASRLAPFKNYLTIVPAFAFVLLAVIGLSRIPVQLNSNEVIPVSVTPSQQNETQPLNESMGALQQMQNLPQASSNGGIKTFPGQLVLPSSYFTGSTSESGGSSSAPSVQNAPSIQSFMSPQPAPRQPAPSATGTPAPQPNTAPQVSAPSAPTFQPVYQPVTFPQNTAPYYQGSVSQPNNGTYQYGQTSVLGTPPSNQNQPQQNLNQTTTVPPSQPVVTPSAPTTSTNQTVPPSSQTSQVSPNPAVEMLTVPAQTTQQATGGSTPVISSPILMAPVINSTIVPAQPTAPAVPSYSESVLQNVATTPNLKVFYNGNFAGSEYSVLQNTIVPQLVAGKSVDSVNVYQKGTNIVGIDLHYTDQHLESFSYSFNPSTNTFLQLRIPTVQQLNQMESIIPTLSTKM